MLDFEQLRALHAAVDEGTFEAAARSYTSRLRRSANESKVSRPRLAGSWCSAPNPSGSPIQGEKSCVLHVR